MDESETTGRRTVLKSMAAATAGLTGLGAVGTATAEEGTDIIIGMDYSPTVDIVLYEQACPFNEEGEILRRDEQATAMDTCTDFDTEWVLLWKSRFGEPDIWGWASEHNVEQV